MKPQKPAKAPRKKAVKKGYVPPPSGKAPPEDVKIEPLDPPPPEGGATET